jgi:hypothetical protein
MKEDQNNIRNQAAVLKVRSCFVVVVSKIRSAISLLLTSWIVLATALADDAPKEKFTYLHDRANTFLRKPDLAEKLENQLRAFNTTQSPLHVVTATSTSFSKDLLAYSNDMRVEFLDGKDGFVLVYEIDSGRFNLSMRDFDEDVLRQDWRPSFVPQHAEVELREQWNQRIKAKVERMLLNNPEATFDPADSVSELTFALMETYGDFAQANPQPNNNFLDIILVSVAMLILFFVAMIFFKRINKKLSRVKLVYRFPSEPCHVALGAHYGGAAFSSVTFSSQS